MRTSTKIMIAVLAVAVILVGTVAAKKYRSYDNVWLGINHISVDEKVAKKYDLAKDHGVYVKGVIDDSPAGELGLERGDLIVGFGDEKIYDSDDLTDILEDYKDGDKVSIEYYRGDDQITAEVELEDRPHKRSFVFSSTPDSYHRIIRQKDHDRGFIGVKLQGLSRQLGEYFGVERGRGALISEVEEEGPAEKAGLKAGDVIVAIDGARIVDVGDVVNDVADLEPGENTEIKIIRDKKESVITVEVGEREDHGSFLGNFWSDDDNEFIWSSDDDDCYFYGGHGFEGLEALEGLEHLQHIQIPRIPSLPGTHFFSRGGHSGHLDFDEDEFDEVMEKLRDELKSLKIELKEIRLKLD